MAISSTAERTLRPLSPVHPSATRLASGDTELRWVRRSREGWAWRDAVDASLSEERETYRIVRTTAAGQVVAEVSAPVFLYDAAMRAADVASGAPNVDFTALQVCAGGVSPPANLTLSLI